MFVLILTPIIIFIKAARSLPQKGITVPDVEQKAVTFQATARYVGFSYWLHTISQSRTTTYSLSRSLTRRLSLHDHRTARAPAMVVQ